MPNRILPELATLVTEPPKGKQWVHEIKFDGYRLLAFKKNSKINLFTRRYNDWTHLFPNIVRALKKLSVKNLILDGEVVVLDKNQRSSFQLLQNAIKEKNTAFYYYVFDLLYYDDHRLINLPLIERKQILKDLSNEFDPNVILFSDHVIETGDRVLKQACKLGLEGIVSKDSTSLYESYRTRKWLKSKCTHRQEFVIGGYTISKKNRDYFGALLVGAYNKKNQLTYHGRVGTGFTHHSLKSIFNLLKQNQINENPFSTRPPGFRTANWVKPVLIAEVEFTEWTKGNTLRHPSFKGLRLDKSTKEIKRERAITLNKKGNAT